MPYIQPQILINTQQLILIFTIAELLVAIPMGQILKRIGLSSWWALLAFVPILGLPALWALAFIRWPKDAA